MPKLKQTPLYQLHTDLGAKMVAFAGYEMPVQYTTGIIQEHKHCREHAGFFDISHMGQCIITGPSVAEQLERLTPSNIVGLKTGQQRYTVLTNAEGGIIDDIIITRTEQGFLIVVNAARKEKDFTHLKQSLSSESHLEILHDQALFALQGPAASNVMTELSMPAATLSFMQACPSQIAKMDCTISRCGYTGEDGFEISIANQHAKTLAQLILAFKQVKPIGLGARDTLRLEAGLSLYGHELTESISPIEAGLKWTFRPSLSHFLGDKVIQSQLEQGANRNRVGLIIDGKIPVRENTELFDSQNKYIGFVSSGSFSPSLKKPIALALIDRLNKEPVLYAKVRNRIITAHITALPFIPHRYQR